MTKTYRSILAMLALTVSVAGASYGQSASMVYKGDITGAPYFSDGTNPFGYYYSNKSGEYWFRITNGLRKFNAVGQWVGDIVFPTSIMADLASP